MRNNERISRLDSGVSITCQIVPFGNYNAKYSIKQLVGFEDIPTVYVVPLTTNTDTVEEIISDTDSYEAYPTTG
ncbi:hypothetical protein [Methanoculleus sp.]|uniref:hypothetical protein n=1 Tax=Methanoculleus sp. TaxID=90427 RepID=UPI001BD2B1D2|nr:hypothetical protein [Methanoculleus sp.]